MMIFSNRVPAVMLTVLVMFACSGCATARHPVPSELVQKAMVGNMDDIRYIMGQHDTAMQASLVQSVKQERPEDFPITADGMKVYPVLAISGGGANGAYGAGLLKGWSKEGSRPVFKVVTGVSTGALIAPFAFLGKDYDGQIEKYYTTISTKDIMQSKGPLVILLGDSLASNKPLADMVACIADDEILAKIAAEHKRGRRLYVGTCNLDAQKFVVWDMGAIAVRGDTELFRKVIVASAAIPVIFPPSIFKVEADGQPYDELHTDGGTLTQVFGIYKLVEGMHGAAEGLGLDKSKIKAKLYIIRNGFMSPIYKQVDDKLASLAEKSFNTIIDAQGAGDAYRIYAFMKERGNDFNLAYIPADFKDDSKEMFDPVAMRKLFDRGYNDALHGYKWHKTPPGLTEHAAPAAKPADTK